MRGVAKDGRRRRRVWALLAALLLAAGVSGAAATTYVLLTLEEIAARADVIVYGVVASVTAAEEDGEPWTVVTLDVQRDLLGGELETYELRLYGGVTADGRSVTVEGMPAFAQGEEVIVFAHEAPYYSPIVGFSQGLWRMGPRGFEDVRGRLLGLDDAGAIQLDGEGAGTDDILAGLLAFLEEAR